MLKRLFKKMLRKFEYHPYYGIVEIKKLELPKGVYKHKIKMKSDCYATVYLKYPRKIEERLLEGNSFGKFRCGHLLQATRRDGKKLKWKLGKSKGEAANHGNEN